MRETSRAATGLGVHRVLEPPRVLPYSATRLNVQPELADGELLVEVEQLNIDSASWRQLRRECDDAPEKMARRIHEIVQAAGKMHNPVTGSGGMFIGRVKEQGPGRREPAVGTRICSLVSLTCTPLVLDRITSLEPDSPQVRVEGQAILPESAGWAAVPDDIDDGVFLSAMDVVGAPAWAARLVQPGMNVAVIGAGGKAGLLTIAQTRRQLGESGKLVGLCWPPHTVETARAAGTDVAVAVDCTDALAVFEEVQRQLDGGLADVVFACANVPGCEGGAILACHDQGRVVFFSMATSFTAAALIAEAVGKYCELTIGTGYLPGGAETVTDLLRSRPELLALLHEHPPASTAVSRHTTSHQTD